MSTSRPIGLGALEFYSSKASAAGFGAREIALLRRRYRQNQSVPAGNGPSNIFVSGQPAVIKSQLAFPGAGGSLALAPSGCLPADDLRQPEQQGAGWRWRQSHNQSVRPTIRMRRCRRLPVPKCRLAPSAGAKFTVSYQAVALALSYMNWAASPSSTEAVRPPPRCWRAMLIIRSSASSVTWSRHEEADPPVRASLLHDHRRDLRAQRRTPSPAIAQSRAQDRDAMTPITAFVALPARREPRFRCRIAAMLAGIL